METPALALGTMLFGTRVPEADAFALLDRFVERGGRWIDTADCYAFWLSESGRGHDSEAVIGRWLAARPDARDLVRISTKVGADPVGDDSWRGWPANREGLSRTAVLDAVDGSAERLGSAIDLLWLHQEDRSTTIGETVDAVSELAASGVVRGFGISNHPAWLVERARAHAAATGGMPVQAVQLALSYLRPRPAARPEGNDHAFGQTSDEQLDHARETGLAVWAYTPLLRGGYERGGIPDAYRHPGSDRRLAALAAAASETGSTPSQIVLAWLAGGADRVVPIVGVRTIAQLDAALDAVSSGLPAHVRAMLDDPEP